VSKEDWVLSSAMLFALLAGASASAWTICLKLSSTRINAALGAMVITGFAFLVNSAALLAMRSRGQTITFTPEAFWLLAVAGVAASGVDIFGLLAYERGLNVTASVVIGGTSIALVLLVGFLVLQEPLTWLRVVAIALITAGILLLQAQGG
jgi:uncharacterized membrane protein